MQLPTINKIYFFVVFLFAVKMSTAQVQTPIIRNTDTTRVIQIIRANSFRQKKIDSVTTLVMLAGDAYVKQGNTILSGDSIVLNQATGVAEVFGNVHINDADSVNTYAQYLKYLGNERMAYLKKDVKLTDGKAILNTQELEYNLATGIAKYFKGGKVINGKTVLTSDDATYYSDTKDVFFKNNVHLVDAKSDMVADSLRYNTEFKEAYFISPTRIKTKEGLIKTRSGTYNVETGEAVFFDRTSYSDSIRYLSGDKMAYDQKNKVLQVEGNGKLVDSVNNVTVLGGQILIDNKTASFLATRKPIMILYRDNDSTYVAADTLFSGLRKYDSSQKKLINVTDTLKNKTAINIISGPDSAGSRKKITVAALTDTSKKERLFKVSRTDSVMSKNAVIDPVTADTSATPDPAYVSVDSSKKNIDTTIAMQDSIRYFLAFHHVRIYNDSLQAVSDSLHYSTEDSTFKLFGSPVFWNDKTQVSGDTMYLFTEKQKAKRLYVFFSGLVVNQTKEGLFNQIGGRTINGYFKDGTIDYIRVKGTPAESVFYPQDDDSAYIGMNRSSGDVIDIFFINKELNKIKFINDVNGTLYPMGKLPEEERLLKGFKWEDKRRPKNKLELFE